MRGRLYLQKLIGFPPLRCCNRRGSSVTYDTTIDNVDIVLDSHQVVDSFHTCVNDNSEFDCIINACRQLFQDSFHNSHVEFNKMKSNEIAHKLARVDPSKTSLISMMMYHHVFDIFLLMK